MTAVKIRGQIYRL